MMAGVYSGVFHLMVDRKQSTEAHIMADQKQRKGIQKEPGQDIDSKDMPPMIFCSTYSFPPPQNVMIL
jgi:hypothetical protein